MSTAPLTSTGLAYRVQGDPDGFPVIALHGTPGSRFSGTPSRDALHALGLRVVTYDRPGYGDTPPVEDRSVRALAADLEQVLDAAGIEGPVGVLAGSSGTASALAFALAHPGRVGAIALVWPIAPRADEPGSPGMGEREWVVGMEEQQRAIHALALQNPVFMREQLEVHLGPEGGAAGIVTDMVQVQEPWDLDLAAVAGPVDIWWGTDSAVSPAGHAVWLSDHLTGAQVTEHRQEEHNWHVRRLVDVFALLGERLGATPRSAEELAAVAAMDVGGGGCGGPGAGGCACGSGGCGA
ncbi:alpha/beta fold hydrolase [Ornithinimicrobium panacihumi]|uniref:alpha/beta fold hydrolase n=1 Tax=Ornithinimicrobium panacihumi TaxID=2008449 RepID=UPI003F8CDD81